MLVRRGCLSLSAAAAAELGSSEVRRLSGDQAINFSPFLFTKGPPLQDRSRRAISVAEQYSLQFDLQRQLDED